MITILIVDDNAPLARFTRAFVLAHVPGAQVLVANDAAAARDRFSSSTPDVVIMDVRLPGVSGIDLLDEFAAQRPGTAFVLISAEPVGDRTIAHLSPRGLVGVLLKPYTARELTDLVQRALARPRKVRHDHDTHIVDPTAGDSVISVDPHVVKAELASILAELYELRAILAQTQNEGGVRDLVDRRLAPLIGLVQQLSRITCGKTMDGR